MSHCKLGKAALVSLCALTLMLTIGCSSAPDDGQILKNVQGQIQKDSAIGGDVSVEAAQGVVTLNGRVTSDANRLLASKEAAGVEGVKQVINNLTVAPSAPAEASAPAPVTPPAPAPKETAKEKEHRRAPARDHAAVASNSEPKPSPFPTAPAPAPVAPPAPPQPVTTAVAPPPPPPPPPPPSKYTIPAGTVLSVRLVDSIDAAKNHEGDTFRATLDSPVRLDGEIVIPAGLDVEGRVVDASKAGRYAGHSGLALQLTKLISRGETYPLQTDPYEKSTGGRGKGTAATVGGGSALGAIIGGIAGGGKGAAIGAIAGAGAGGAVRGAKGAENISFPSETVLTFTLQQSLTVGHIPAPDRSRTPMSD